MNEWTDWHEKHSDKIVLVAGIDCWIWDACHVKGYGRVSYNRQAEFAHRAAYMEAGGAFECGPVVRHMCGNPSCVRPGHLKSGTLRDNAADTARMFRTASKLVASDVVGIRESYKNGASLQEIADAYGIAFGTVFPIVVGKTFRHVAPETIIPNGNRTPRKLSADRAAEIRRRALNGESQSALSREFGVAQSVISRIKTGDRWSITQDRILK